MDVTSASAANKIELYISPDCPYCAEAMAFYDSRKVPYTTYDAQNNLTLREKMFAYTHGEPTVPAIVIDGKYIQSGWGKPPRG